MARRWKLLDWIHTECSCEKDSLLLPAGKLSVAMIGKILDHHFFHCFLRNTLFFFVIKWSQSAAALASGQNDLPHYPGVDMQKDILDRLPFEVEV